VIDLHLHTTASDGLLSPDALVERLAEAGIHTFSVTDHDTVAGLARAEAAAARHGLRFVPGIEITAVEDGLDVHMLGYGFDPTSSNLLQFLEAQRAERLMRAYRIIDRLRELGMPLEADQVIGQVPPSSGKAIGRPAVARALVAKGYCDSVSDAFNRFLGSGKPGFMPRTGAPAADVVDIIARAGGVASMAHPGVTKRDELIPGLVARGLVAIEVWHSDHDDETTMRYLAQAEALGLHMTGGSDYHGDLPDRNARLGAIGIPQAAFERFLGVLRDARTRIAFAPGGAIDGNGSGA
jgi:predicted metal-dependent phosphoesterase TrpH